MATKVTKGIMMIAHYNEPEHPSSSESYQTMPPAHHDYLTRRGIADAACFMRWHPTTWRLSDGTQVEGFDFLIIDPTGQRKSFRAIVDHHDGWKRIWRPGGSAPKLYIPPGIEEAIAGAGGALIIAAGEIDLLTIIEAGHCNVIAILGETNIPSNIADIATKLGATHIDYWIDNDDTGRKSGRKLLDRLDGSRITANVYTLADHVPEKGDLNDIWRMVEQDAARFWEVLRSCSLADLPASTKPRQPRRDSNFDPRDRVHPDLARDVIRAIEELPGARWNGAWLNACAAWRGEKNASFGLNTETWGWNDFTGESGFITDLAPRLGIDPRDYRQPPKPPTTRQGRSSPPRPVELEPEIEVPAMQITALPGIPNRIRTSLQYVGRGGSAAPVVEAIHTAIRQGDLSDTFIVSQALDTSALTGFSRRTLERVLNDLTGIVFEDVASNLHPLNNQSQGGKSVATYRFRPLDEIEATLDDVVTRRLIEQAYPKDDVAIITQAMLEEGKFDATLVDDARELTADLLEQQRAADRVAGHRATRWARVKRARQIIRAMGRHVTPLPDGFDLSNPRQYRGAYLRALVGESDEGFSRGEKALLLGCSKRSLPEIETVAGIENIEDVRRVPVRQPHQVQRAAKSHEAFPRALVAVAGDGHEVKQPYYKDAAQAFAESHLGDGKEVYVEMQHKNRQVLVEPTLPAPKPPKSPTPDDPAGQSDQPGTPPPNRPISKPKRRKAERRDWMKFDPEWVRRKMVIVAQQAAVQRRNQTPPTGDAIITPAGVVIYEPTPDEISAVIRGDEPDALIALAVELGASVELIQEE